MNKPTRILLLFGVAVLAFVVLALLGSTSRNQSALQEYKAELRARGEKLTYEELPRSPSTNANHSLAKLTNAVAKIGNVRFQPGNIEVRKFVGPGRARVAWIGDSPSWQSSTGGGAQLTWADLAEEMAGANLALAEIREALKEPAPNSGSPTNILPLPVSNFVAIRNAAQWLTGSALNETRQGHLEVALQDLEALAALAEMNRAKYTLVSQMIRIAIAGLGLSATWPCRRP
jgi:hypothetical protein